MLVCYQRQSPAALLPGKRPGTITILSMFYSSICLVYRPRICTGPFARRKNWKAHIRSKCSDVACEGSI